MCLLHYVIQEPWANTDPSVCETKAQNADGDGPNGCLKRGACAPKHVCPPAATADAGVHDYRDEKWQRVEDLINLVEAPEVALMKFAHELFDKRFKEAGEHVKCQIASEKLSGKEEWIGPGCWGIKPHEWHKEKNNL